MLWNHLRHGARRLRLEPGFTAAAVLTLAIGIGANVAVFAVVEAVLLRPLPYPAAEELVVVRHRDDRTAITKEFIPIGDFVDLAARQSAFQGIGAYGQYRATIFGEDEPYQVSALAATAATLEALGFRAGLGRGLLAADQVTGAGPVVVLGHDLWRTRFGADSTVVGRTIRIGSVDHLVVGVAPRGFRFPPTASTGIITAMTLPAEAPAARKSGWVFAVGRLAPGQTIAGASSDLAALSRQFAEAYPDQNAGSIYYGVSLRDEVAGDTRRPLILLFAAVITVLLIACTNVANLLLTRSLGRRREMAVRMALGAGRSRLAVQLGAESLILAGAAGAAGLLMAWLGIGMIRRLLPASLGPEEVTVIGLNPTILLFALIVTLGTALGCGLVTAFTTPFSAAPGLLVAGGRSSLSPRARRATGALVVGEIAFAVVLLMGAGLILRSFASILRIDPGIRTDHLLVLSVSIPAERYQAFEAREAFFDRALRDLGDLPGVAAVGAAAVVPLTGNNWTAPFDRVDQPAGPGERPPEVGWQLASGGFFRSLGIPLIAGRLFERTDRTDQPGQPAVVIVSAALQRRFFGAGSAVGQRIKLGQGQAEIVGVVGDVRRASLTDEPRAELYFPFENIQPTETNLFIRTAGDPDAAFGDVRARLRAIEPGLTILSHQTMGEIAAESLRTTRLLLWLLGVFAAVALILAAVGIYGVMAYVVRQRTWEIGTRMALGADRGLVLRMVLRQGGTLAVLGIVGGLLGGLVAARALSSLLYNVSTADPVAVFGAAAALAVTAATACFIPARRAASVDPARALSESSQ